MRAVSQQRYKYLPLLDSCKIGLGFTSVVTSSISRGNSKTPRTRFLKRINCIDGDELYDLIEPNEALLHDIRLTMKDSNEKIRKRHRFSSTVDAERMSIEIVE